VWPRNIEKESQAARNNANGNGASSADIFSQAVISLTRTGIDREPRPAGEPLRAVACGPLPVVVTILPGEGGLLRGAG
jgi:hypothetical protein